MYPCDMDDESKPDVTLILVEDLVALVKVAMVAEDQPADIEEMMGDIDPTEVHDRVTRIERRAGEAVKKFLGA